MVDHWAAAGEIHRIHRAVYAVGHTALSTEGQLTAAVLFAGPDAMLSHGTAAWWFDLTSRRPSTIHVSTPRQCVSCPGVEVHDRRPLIRTWHRGIPIAPVSDTLADLAGTEDIRYLLSQADFHGVLDLEDLSARRNPALRAALTHHQPALAHTRSEFERRLVRLCERHGIPIPELNVRIEGHRVDAVWRRQKVIVELDGRDGHASWARIRADHARDATLRGGGWAVLRYVWEQPDGVIAADILTALGRDGAPPRPGGETVSPRPSRSPRRPSPS